MNGYDWIKYDFKGDFLNETHKEVCIVTNTIRNTYLVPILICLYKNAIENINLLLWPNLL